MRRWIDRTWQGWTQFHHSIRFRLVLWFVLILAVVMVVFSAFLYYRQAQDVRSNAIDRLNYIIDHTLGGHDREGLAEQSGIVQPLLTPGTSALAGSLPEGEILALQGPDGSLKQSAGALTSGQIQQLALPLPGWSGVVQAPLPKSASGYGGRYLFADPSITQDGQLSGYLLVGVPLDPNNQLGRLLISLILGNALTLAIALTGGFWLADRAMRPVRTITQTANQISETDLHKRLNLKGQDELAQLGGTFDAMLTRLQAAFERQRQFTADASHELRTPLTIIDLETSRGLSAKRSPEEYECIMGTIQAENKFMVRLVNNLLSLARMDAGQVKLKSEPLDLSELASEVIERMQPLATAQGVALEVGSMPEALVRGDRATLSLMLINLLENAIKFSSGAASPTVSISVGKAGGIGTTQAWIRVCDNGIGISTEHQAHIFDRFYQAEASRSRPISSGGDGARQESSGTGLGLAIAQWIARAHHGEIRVESAIGKGSTFEVVLPSFSTGE